MVLGFDPAFRTGAKLAVVDQTGKLMTTQVIYPVAPASQAKIEQSKKDLAELISSYGIEIIAIGNGTASRESEAFVAQVLKDFQTFLMLLSMKAELLSTLLLSLLAMSSQT